MPFIPHTQEDVESMLGEIGVASIDALFDEIPIELRNGSLREVPEGLSELAMLQAMNERAALDEGYVCFMGAGSYDHHIPAAVWDLTSRGEFRTKALGACGWVVPAIPSDSIWRAKPAVLVCKRFTRSVIGARSLLAVNACA